MNEQIHAGTTYWSIHWIKVPYNSSKEMKRDKTDAEQGELNICFLVRYNRPLHQGTKEVSC